MGSLNWTPEWYHPGRKTPAEIARDAVDIMFDGMVARPAVKPAKIAKTAKISNTTKAVRHRP